MAYVHVAAAAAKAQRQVVDELKKAGALSEDKAIPLADLDATELRMLEQLKKREVVRETMKGGRYWLDVVRQQEYEASQVKLVIGFLILFLGVLIVVLLYG